MNFTSITIKDLLQGEKLTFLVGAGCSMDPPSCLAAGRPMMDAIIDYMCAESEIEEIKKLEQLRFEGLMEILRDVVDPKLKVIDYYGLSDKPNIQHFFLAEMLKKGHFVLTTNFDFLIDYALKQSGVHDEDIIPVITRDDYEKFKDPYEQYRMGKKAIYKIHGSTKNVITDENTRESLIATIQAFGSNKEGKNVFQLESFKQPAFENLTENRSLVIIGYSGSDDFDIVPTLKALKNLNKLIWINYMKDDNSSELVYEITPDLIDEAVKLDKVNRILVEIKRINNKLPIFRTDVNTTRMVTELLEIIPQLQPEKFSVKAIDWIKEIYPEPDDITKYIISSRIYHSMDMYDKAMIGFEEVVRISDELGDLRAKAYGLNNMAVIYASRGNYDKGLELHIKVLDIREQLGDLRGKAESLHNIGQIYKERGNYSEALRYYEEVLDIVTLKQEEPNKTREQMNNLKIKASTLVNIGEVYQNQANYPMALNQMEKALNIVEKLGDLNLKAVCLGNMSNIYIRQGDFPLALQKYGEALKISKQLGYFSNQANCLNNIAFIHNSKGNYPEALKHFEEALHIMEQLGNLNGKATCLHNIGGIYRANGESHNALKNFEESLRLNDESGNLAGKSQCLNSIATIFLDEGKYPEALKYFEEALNLSEQMGDLNLKVICLNNIGQINYLQGNYSKALDLYKKSLDISEELGILPNKPVCLNNIGDVYKSRNEFRKARKQYKHASKIFEELGDLKGKAISLNNIGLVFCEKRSSLSFMRAQKLFDEALDILENIGLRDSPEAEIINKNLKMVSDALFNYITGI